MKQCSVGGGILLIGGLYGVLWGKKKEELRNSSSVIPTTTNYVANHQIQESSKEDIMSDSITCTPTTPWTMMGLSFSLIKFSLFFFFSFFPCHIAKFLINKYVTLWHYTGLDSRTSSFYDVFFCFALFNWLSILTFNVSRTPQLGKFSKNYKTHTCGLNFKKT